MRIVPVAAVGSVADTTGEQMGMPTLFTYVVRTDYGSAPNPFWGVCTLVVCKPQIRRAARVGDWVVGTGPTRSPIGDIRGMIIYAMRVTGRMTMREYDAWARGNLPEKVPDGRSSDPWRRVGDALWDFGGFSEVRLSALTILGNLAMLREHRRGQGRSSPGPS